MNCKFRTEDGECTENWFPSGMCEMEEDEEDLCVIFEEE